MSRIRVHDLKKRYRGGEALAGIDLELSPGEITVVLGPSGCGKTTLLRILAGLIDPDEGRVEFDDEIVNDPKSRVPPEKRGLGMVFQDALLWPHLTIRRNIGFALAAEGRSEAVKTAAAAARIEAFLDRYPAQLSGGERQRAAIARAIAGRPRLLLLDEPLSGLDANLRDDLLGTIRRVQRELELTACYVTHDQEEALGVADRMVIMRGGRILQTGTPEEIYRAPRTAFVAGFVGLSTLVRGEADGSGRVSTDLGPIPVDPESRGRLLFAIRPEAAHLGEGGGFPGRVESCRFRGDRWLVTVRVGARNVLVTSPVKRDPGEEVSITFDPAPVAVLDDEEAQ